MVKVTSRALEKTIDIDREIGRYTQNKPGPTTIIIGGTHGNETSSLFALDKIFKALNRLQPPFRGEMIAAYAGNLSALEKDVRYIDRDMNRIWVPSRLKRLGFLDEDHTPAGVEKNEQEELISLLHTSFAEAKGKVHVFDLHTTSSVSPPFIAIGDTIRNRRLALQYPLPCVVGFDEETSGTFMNFINELGYAGIAFEAGEHFSLAAVENNISFIWHTLAVTGCMEKEDIPEYNVHYENLSKTTLGDQRIFDLKYRYEIKHGEKFKMKSGYATFDKVEKGETVAENENGEIKSPYEGRIFMPLYQAQGDDGFFILEEISDEWLKKSERLRECHADEMFHLLPGIEQHTEDDHTLVLNTPDPDEWMLELLHLLGYRRKRVIDGKLYITRRQYDVEGPEKYT